MATTTLDLTANQIANANRISLWSDVPGRDVTPARAKRGTIDAIAT